MDEDFLWEQICYYQARAAEYDGSILGDENVALGGQLCIIDEPDSPPARPLPADSAADDAWREMRALRDGRRFQIVKIYYPPEQLKVRCAEVEFAQAMCFPGTYFFGLIAQ